MTSRSQSPRAARHLLVGVQSRRGLGDAGGRADGLGIEDHQGRVLSSTGFLPHLTAQEFGDPLVQAVLAPQARSSRTPPTRPGSRGAGSATGSPSGSGRRSRSRPPAARRDPRSPVADRATRSCFQAVIIGSINAHCASDESLRYGSLSMPRISTWTWRRHCPRSVQYHDGVITNRGRRDLSSSVRPPVQKYCHAAQR